MGTQDIHSLEVVTVVSGNSHNLLREQPTQDDHDPSEHHLKALNVIDICLLWCS